MTEYRDAGVTPDFTQQDINAEYANLYNAIVSARDTAHADGKRLAIIIGESHRNRDSGLITSMVADIAMRLGIKDFVVEQDLQSVQSLQNYANHNITGLNRIIAQDAHKPFKKDSYFSCMVEFIRTLQSSTGTDGRNVLNAQPNIALLSTVLGLQGFSLHAGDPQLQQRLNMLKENTTEDDYRPFIDRTYEEPMADCIIQTSAQNADLVGLYGANHITGIQAILAEKAPTIQPFMINATASCEQEIIGTTEDIRARTASLSNYYTPTKIRGKESHLLMSEVLAMTLEASIRHSESIGTFKSADERIRTLAQTLQNGMHGCKMSRS